MQVAVDRSDGVRITYTLDGAEWAAQPSLDGKSGLYSWAAEHGLTVSVDPFARQVVFSATEAAWGSWAPAAGGAIPYYMVIDPDAAIMSGGVVSSIPATGSITGQVIPSAATVTRPADGELALGGEALALPQAVDLRGKRVFIPYVRSGSAQPYLMGQSDGDGLDLRLVTNAYADGTLSMQLKLGSAYTSRMPRSASTGWFLYEMHVGNDGTMRVLLDGVEFPPVTIDASAPLTVDLIGRDYLASTSTPANGRLGKVVILDAPTDQQANLVRERLLLAYKPEAAPIPQTLGRDVDTSRWTALDIQMEAVTQRTADAALGINRSDEADPNFYHGLIYLNHSEYPVVMSQPQPPMADIRKYLPGADILRTGFNRWHLTATGDFIEPSVQTMIAEWIASGGRWQPVHMWLGQENAPQPIRDQGTAAILDYVRTTVPAEIKEGWARFRLWYEKQTPEVRAGIVALEMMNEPDIYKKSHEMDPAPPQPDYWPQLFAQHQIEIAREIAVWWDGPIMPALFAYNARTAELITPSTAGVTPKARIVAALGNRLIWSWHLYPSWGSGDTIEAYWQGRQPTIDFAAPYRIVMTETNAGEYDPAMVADQGFHMTRLLPRFLEAGVGIGFFSAINYASALVSFWSSPVSLRNPDRVGAFINAATFNKGFAYDYSDTTTRVLRSGADPRAGTDTGVHIHVGGAGGDVFTAGDLTTFAFGADGNDVLTISPTRATWFYGQNGDDIIHAEVGPFAVVILGHGDDTVYLGADRVMVYGASGADRFVLGNSGTAFIDNFDIGEDLIDARLVFPSLSAFTAATTASGADLVIALPGGGSVTLLRRATASPADVAVPW